ncbi:hypothetical protein OAG71_01645 [bacterium]|nr:hypothetical protein [bacterium]
MKKIIRITFAAAILTASIVSPDRSSSELAAQEMPIQPSIAALSIDGPYEALSGQLVRLEAQTIPGETPFWIVLEPTSMDYEQVDGGQRLIFAAPCDSVSSITVMLLAQQVREGRIVTRQLRRSITLNNKTDPPPLSPPSPKPDNPEGDFGDLKQSPVYEAVSQAWPNIRTDAAKSLSNRVVENLALTAKSCEEGRLSKLSEIWKTLSIANRKALGVESSAWDPVGIAMQSAFQELGLKDVNSHGFHLRAAAAAIKRLSTATSFNQKSRLGW